MSDENDKGNDKKGGIASFGIAFGQKGAQEPPAKTPERGSFRILVIGELAGRDDSRTSARPSFEPRPIDRYTFDARLAELAPALALEVADPFDPRAPAVRVDGRFGELRSFRPDGLVESFPVLRALVDARRVLEATRDGRTNLDAARATLGRALPRIAWVDALLGDAPPAQAEVREVPKPSEALVTEPSSMLGTGLDALLSRIDVGGEPAPAPKAPSPEPARPAQSPASIVAAVAKSARPGASSARATDLASAITRAEKAAAALLGSILRHPEVRALERAWRGLKLLVDRADTRSGVEIDAVAAAPDEVEEVLRTVLSGAGSESVRPPVDLVVVDVTLSANARDLSRAEAWAALGAALRAPVVTGGDASLLGFDDLPSLQRSQRRIESLDDVRGAGVRGLASREVSRWLAIAINGILVRAPYDPSSARLREIGFREDVADRTHSVFACPAFALAALAAGSFVRNRFASELTGARAGQLDNLPVREVTENDVTYAFPLEHLVSVETQKTVANIGFVLLGCAPNHDAAIVVRAPTLYRGEKASQVGEPAPETTLGDQLFAARLSHAIEQLAAAIPSSTDPRAIDEVVKLSLAELFAAGRKGPDVSTRVERGQLFVTVVPHGYASVGFEEVTLAAPLG